MPPHCLQAWHSDVHCRRSVVHFAKCSDAPDGKWHFERIPSKTIGTRQEQAPPMAANQPGERCAQQKCRVGPAYTFAPLIYFCILPRRCRSLPTPPDLSTLQNSAPDARRQPQAHAAAHRSGSSILSRAQVSWSGGICGCAPPTRAAHIQTAHRRRSATALRRSSSAPHMITPRRRCPPCGPRRTRAAPRAPRHARRRPSAAWACSAQVACRGRAGSQSRAAAGCR